MGRRSIDGLWFNSFSYDMEKYFSLQIESFLNQTTYQKQGTSTHLQFVDAPP